MNIVKARIQGNATVVTIPKSFNVKPGNGTLILSSSKKVPDSIEELFKNWHGKYEVTDEMKEWDEMKSEGREIW